jgi:hypothetical protein
MAFIDEALNTLDQEDPILIEAIKKLIRPPTGHKWPQSPSPLYLIYFFIAASHYHTYVCN